MRKIYGKVAFVSLESTGFCPGCGHGTVHKFIAQSVEKNDIRERTMIVEPVGCGGLGGFTINLNVVNAAHGRAGAIATAIKRCNPQNIIIAYQGDGDLASIGMAETMHAANRGESITVLFINNCNFGMTGGQMAPTTMLGQKATTSPEGRDLKIHGAPFKMAELIATLDAPQYVARVAVHSAKHALKARQIIDQAIQIQMRGEGYSFIEVISMCPTNWKLSPAECIDYIEEAVLSTYPLGVIKS